MPGGYGGAHTGHMEGRVPGFPVGMEGPTGVEYGAGEGIGSYG